MTRPTRPVQQPHLIGALLRARIENYRRFLPDWPALIESLERDLAREEQRRDDQLGKLTVEPAEQNDEAIITEATHQVVAPDALLNQPADTSGTQA